MEQPAPQEWTLTFTVRAPITAEDAQAFIAEIRPMYDDSDPDVDSIMRVGRLDMRAAYDEIRQRNSRLLLPPAGIVKLDTLQIHTERFVDN